MPAPRGIPSLLQLPPALLSHQPSPTVTRGSSRSHSPSCSLPPLSPNCLHKRVRKAAGTLGQRFCTGCSLCPECTSPSPSGLCGHHAAHGQGQPWPPIQNRRRCHPLRQHVRDFIRHFWRSREPRQGHGFVCSVLCCVPSPEDTVPGTQPAHNGPLNRRMKDSGERASCSHRRAE